MITISLCMIVKNEEKTLPRCLDSVKDIADEIIIVDTGSTDNTKKIARKYTNKILDFKWIDDFSAARNYSFSQAKMDYILWLDADDIMTPKDRKKLLKLKYESNTAIDAYMLKYNVGYDEYGNINFWYYRERIVKRENNFKWQSSIHETIDIAGNIKYLDICITHNKPQERITNYSDRNLKIFEKILLEKKGLDTRQLYYYSKELMYNKKYKKAIKYFKQYILKEDAWIEDKINACIDLATCYASINDNNNYINTLFKTFEYDTPRPVICTLIGMYYSDNFKYDQAIFWYTLSLQITKNNLNTINYSFVCTDYLDYIPYINLSNCYFNLNDLLNSLKYSKLALKSKPNSLLAKNNIKILNELIASTRNK